MLDKISKIMTSIIMSFCGITVVGLASIVAIQVITRLVDVSFPWTEELARFFLIWLTFLGCSLALYQDSHLSVEFFVKLAPKKVQLIIGIVVHAFMIAFFGVIVVYGVKLSIVSMETLSSTMRWPMGLVYMVLPLSGLISIYYIVIKAVAFVKNSKEVEA